MCAGKVYCGKKFQMSLSLSPITTAWLYETLDDALQVIEKLRVLHFQVAVLDPIWAIVTCVPAIAAESGPNNSPHKKGFPSAKLSHAVSN